MAVAEEEALIILVVVVEKIPDLVGDVDRQEDAVVVVAEVTARTLGVDEEEEVREETGVVVEEEDGAAVTALV